MNLKESMIIMADKNKDSSDFLNAYLKDKSFFGEDTAEVYAAVYEAITGEDNSALFESVDEALEITLLEAGGDYSDYFGKAARKAADGSFGVMSPNKVNDVTRLHNAEKILNLKNLKGEYLNKFPNTGTAVPQKDWFNLFGKAGEKGVNGSFGVEQTAVMKQAKEALKVSNPGLFGKIGSFFAGIKKFFTGENGAAMPALAGIKKGLSWLISPAGLPVALGTTAGVLAIGGIIKLLKKKGKDKQAMMLQAQAQNAIKASKDTKENKKASLDVLENGRKCTINSVAQTKPLAVAKKSKADLTIRRDNSDIRKANLTNARDALGARGNKSLENKQGAGASSASPLELEKRRNARLYASQNKVKYSKNTMKEDILGVLGSRSDRLNRYLNEDTLEERYVIGNMEPRGGAFDYDTLAKQYVESTIKTLYAEKGKSAFTVRAAVSSIVHGIKSTFVGNGAINDKTLLAAAIKDKRIAKLLRLDMGMATKLNKRLETSGQNQVEALKRTIGEGETLVDRYKQFSDAVKKIAKNEEWILKFKPSAEGARGNEFEGKKPSGNKPTKIKYSVDVKDEEKKKCSKATKEEQEFFDSKKKKESCDTKKKSAVDADDTSKEQDSDKKKEVKEKKEKAWNGVKERKAFNY